MSYLLFLFFIASSVHANNTLSHQLFQQHNSRLFNDLFKEYHREMSPYNGHGVLNDTYPLTPVTITLQYARLIRVFEPQLQHQNLIGLVLEWQDPRLRWDPTLYGGIDHIYLNRFTTWMPEFYSCESSQSSIVANEQSLTIGLNATGHMNVFIIHSIFYSCEFDVYRFPFDNQNCYYCFIMYNYNAKDELRFDVKVAPRPRIYDTSEWSLKLAGHRYEDSIDPEFNMGLLYYNISLTRRPQFWVGLVITPTFVIGSLIIIGLFFGRGEDIINNAVGLGLTTMMSMMVIVGILANAIAKSQYIPILGWYIIAEIMIITLAVLALLSSEMLCNFCSTLVHKTCRESKYKTLNYFHSLKVNIREFLIERGKHSHVWIFLFFFIAHSINLVVLFCV